MDWLKKMLHKLAHRFGHNTGEVETFWHDQALMVGFRCHGCGELGGVHESRVRRERPNARLSGP